MKNIKKIFILITFVLLVGALGACSSINKVSRNFTNAGYSLYEYNFRGGSIMFSVVDDVVDDLNITVPPQTNVTTTTTAPIITEETTSGTNTTATTVTQTVNILASLVGFRAYAFSNGLDKVVIVIEFQSEDYMNEVLETSLSLQALLEGLDPADYINGNCIMIADESYYEEAVDIFQGRYIPQSTTTTTTETTSETTDTTVE
jgi:hypothetical protein